MKEMAEKNTTNWSCSSIKICGIAAEIKKINDFKSIKNLVYFVVKENSVIKEKRFYFDESEKT